MHRKTFSALAMASALATAGGGYVTGHGSIDAPAPRRQPFRYADGRPASFRFQPVGDKTRGYGSGRSQAKRRKIARRRGAFS